MAVQKARILGVIFLVVVVLGFMLPSMATFHFNARDGVADAAITFFLAIVLPATAYIAANLSMRGWQQNSAIQARPTIGWISVALIALSASYLAIFFFLIAFVWTKDVAVSTPGFNNPVTQTIDYPLDQGMSTLATYFGTLLTWVLSLEIFSIRTGDPID